MRISPISYNTTASFRGIYKEQIDKSMPDSYKPYIEGMRSHMQEAASIIGKDSTLYLTGCADGIRIGYSEKLDYSNDSNNILESKETIKFSKPMNIRDSYFEFLYLHFEDVIGEVIMDDDDY